MGISHADVDDTRRREMYVKNIIDKHINSHEKYVHVPCGYSNGAVSNQS